MSGSCLFLFPLALDLKRGLPGYDLRSRDEATLYPLAVAKNYFKLSQRRYK